LNDDSTR